MPPSKVDLYAAVRRDARAGMSGRAIEKKYRVGRRTIVSQNNPRTRGDGSRFASEPVPAQRPRMTHPRAPGNDLNKLPNLRFVPLARSAPTSDAELPIRPAAGECQALAAPAYRRAGRLAPACITSGYGSACHQPTRAGEVAAAPKAGRAIGHTGDGARA